MIWGRCFAVVVGSVASKPGNSTAFVWVVRKGVPPVPCDVLIVPCAPFTWESPCVELIFSTRVPVRNAAADCRVWERRVGVINPPGRSPGDVEECDSRRLSSEPWSSALPNLLGRWSRQRHLTSRSLGSCGRVCHPPILGFDLR